MVLLKVLILSTVQGNINWTCMVKGLDANLQESPKIDQLYESADILMPYKFDDIGIQI